MGSVRIAVCQIECHPALHAGYTHPMEEPFMVPHGKASLALLGTKGIDTGQLQRVCKEKYLLWSETRLRNILAYLDQMDPVPDIVLFPEGSIPLPLLPLMAEWSGRTGCMVLGGSHTPILGKQGRKHFDKLGISKQVTKGLERRNVANVLPIMDLGKTTLIEKRLHSPFEKSETSPKDAELPSMRTVSFNRPGVPLLSVMSHAAC